MLSPRILTLQFAMWKMMLKSVKVLQYPGRLASMLYTYLTITAVKYIEWTIVHIVSHVMGKILHLHLYRVALVVFSAFEFLVSVFLPKSLKKKMSKMRLTGMNCQLHVLPVQGRHMFRAQ